MTGLRGDTPPPPPSQFHSKLQRAPVLPADGWALSRAPISDFIMNFKKEESMPVERLMEKLNEYEAQAAADIRLDHQLKADPYDSVGRHKLIRKIQKLIARELNVDIHDFLRKEK
jgi:hypothetical protein